MISFALSLAFLPFRRTMLFSVTRKSTSFLDVVTMEPGVRMGLILEI